MAGIFWAPMLTGDRVDALPVRVGSRVWRVFVDHALPAQAPRSRVGAGNAAPAHPRLIHPGPVMVHVWCQELDVEPQQ